MVLTGTPLCRRADDFIEINAGTCLGAGEQVPNGVVVAPNGHIYCVASEKGKEYCVSTADPYIGKSVTYQGHEYRVAGEERDNPDNYVLICHEKKAGAEFMNIDAEYGVITVARAALRAENRRASEGVGHAWCLMLPSSSHIKRKAENDLIEGCAPPGNFAV